MCVSFLSTDSRADFRCSLIWSLKDTLVISFILNVESVKSRLASRYTSNNPIEAFELQLQSAILSDYHGPLSPPDSPDAAYTATNGTGQLSVPPSPFGVGMVTTVTTSQTV